MDGFIMAFGVVLALVGLYGLYFAATGRSALQNATTRFLFAIRGAEPSRLYTALTSGVLVAFGAYVILSSLRPSVPLWPGLIAVLVAAVFQLAAVRLHRRGA